MAFNINIIVLVWQLQILAGSDTVFYIYDHETGQVIEWNAIQPLGHKTYLDEQPLFNQSYFSKSPYQFDIQHANGVRYIRVTKYGEICLSARIFCAGTDILSLCTPTGINGWTYTQKQTTLAVEECSLISKIKLYNLMKRHLLHLMILADFTS